MSPSPDASPALTLEAFRKETSTVLAGLEHPPLGSGVALAEECGEVAKILLDVHGYGRPLDPAALAGELVDVLVCIAEIATAHGIDLDRAARTKLDDLARRAPAWRADPVLMQALAKRRAAAAP